MSGFDRTVQASKTKLLAIAKSVFRAMGLEISFADTVATERNILRGLFKSYPFGFVLDVGANTGQYGALVRNCGYRGPIVSFEPLLAAYDELTQRAASDPCWTVADRGALGAAAGHATINVAGNSASSSLLDMNPVHASAAPHSAYVAMEQIKVYVLDDCIERYVGDKRCGLLKIDTQGYEMEVLRGAQRTLSDRIIAVQTELSLIELYRGQPLMLDVCDFMRKHGFSLHQIIPGFKDPASGRLLQLDGIFAKDTAVPS